MKWISSPWNWCSQRAVLPEVERAAHSANIHSFILEMNDDNFSSHEIMRSINVSEVEV